MRWLLQPSLWYHACERCRLLAGHNGICHVESDKFIYLGCCLSSQGICDNSWLYEVVCCVAWTGLKMIRLGNLSHTAVIHSPGLYHMSHSLLPLYTHMTCTHAPLQTRMLPHPFKSTHQPHPHPPHIQNVTLENESHSVSSNILGLSK